MSDKQEKIRADVLLVSQGLVSSRERAQALIMAGEVYFGESQVRKASQQFGPEDSLTLRPHGVGYVSRGALKLVRGLEVFPVDPRGRDAMDIGASTGGFTDVLLKNGAAHVYAIDVGYGQFDWSLRQDPRVTVMEKTNARYLKPEDLQTVPDLCVMDVSFISVSKILPAAALLMQGQGEFILLIKPQFEAGRESVGKKGVVRDEQVHVRVIRQVLDFIREELPYRPAGLTHSPIRGPEGNIEFLLYLVPRASGIPGGVSDEDIVRTVRQAHENFDKETGDQP